MSRALALLLIGLVFGGAFGFVIAAANGVTLDGHDHSQHLATDGEGDAHDHSDIIEATGTPPTITAEITPDPASGWNLHIRTTNFTFAPEASGAAHVEGQGHAHIYANGIKIARAYGPWFHIAALPEGAVEILVTLNTNDHRAIGVDGAPVQTAITLTNAP